LSESPSSPAKRRRPTAEKPNLVDGPSVGIVGLGEMGLPIARKLLAQGRRLTFYARRPEIRSTLVALGATDGVSLGGMARCSDVVIVCVYDDDAVKEVCLGPDGVVRHLRAGSVLINHTTGHPATARSLSRHARVSRAHFLDVPVSGGPADIEAGRLTLLVGGRTDLLRRVAPVFECYADRIVAVGKVGDAQWVKLLNNALFSANLALVRDAERVISELGLPVGPTLDAITGGSGASRVLQLAAQMGSSQRLIDLAGRFVDKDLNTVEEVAHAGRVDLGVLGWVAALAKGDR
jgi:3-hydroxyisobutyrate dehydrogenase-like beta-hydroxyacid dehydrogenase